MSGQGLQLMWTPGSVCPFLYEWLGRPVLPTLVFWSLSLLSSFFSGTVTMLWRGYAHRRALTFLAVQPRILSHHTCPGLPSSFSCRVCISHRTQGAAIHHPKACLAAVALGQLGVEPGLRGQALCRPRHGRSSSLASCRQARADLALSAGEPLPSNIANSCRVAVQSHACMRCHARSVARFAGPTERAKQQLSRIALGLGPREKEKRSPAIERDKVCALRT